MSVPMLLPEVQAAILAGGASTRMGTPKWQLDFRGNTFIAHLLAALQPQVNRVFIAGAPDPRQLADLGVAVLPDTQPQCGPLGGIVTALRDVERPWLLTVPCDNPLLPANYAARLLGHARQTQAPLVYVCKHRKAQPLYALLRRELVDSLASYLASGERRVMPWFESVGAVAMDWDDVGAAFDNINTPDEYAAFLAAN